MYVSMYVCIWYVRIVGRQQNLMVEFGCTNVQFDSGWW